MTTTQSVNLPITQQTPSYPLPTRQLLAELMLYFEQDLRENSIPIKNLLVKTSNFYKVQPQHEKKVREIFESVLRDTKFYGNDPAILRAFLDDTRHGVVGHLQDICQILDVLVPRHRDIARSHPADMYVQPLEGDPVLTADQVVAMLITEPSEYIRRRIQWVCQRDNPSIPDQPTDEQIKDMEMAEGTWMVTQTSNEGIALSAALNYSPTEVRDTEIPRFAYISKALAPLREMTMITPNGNSPVMKFVCGAANALLRYMQSNANGESPQRQDSIAEAIDLFNSCHYFRHSLGSHREMASSVILRLNNGKPAYIDLTNLVSGSNAGP